MAASRERKPLSWKSLVGQSLFVVLLLSIACVLWKRQQPESLSTPPVHADRVTVLALTDDTRYLEMTGVPGKRSTAIELCAQSLQNGSLRTLCTIDAPDTTFAGSDLREGTLYYASRFTPPQKILLRPANFAPHNTVSPTSVAKNAQPVASAPGSVVTGRDLGTFLLQTQISAAGAPAGRQRTPVYKTYFPPSEIRVGKIPQQGGTPQQIVTLPCSSCYIVEDHAFWIQSTKEETMQVTQGERPQERLRWLEISPQSDLMLTSLADGTTRCIHHGIPRETHLVKGNSGISWSEPSPYPKPPTLYYAHASDGSVRALGSIPQGQEPPSVTEFDGHLYWLASDIGAQTYALALMTADLNGSGIHPLSGITERHSLNNMQLYVHQGRLYSYLQEKTQGNTDIYTISLCRLHPDRSDSIEILSNLSKKGIGADTISELQFGGNYFYFQRYASPDQWKMTLLGEAGQNLYRLPLEH